MSSFKLKFDVHYPFDSTEKQFVIYSIYMIFSLSRVLIRRASDVQIDDKI
jgi:hypothetical protein